MVIMVKMVLFPKGINSGRAGGAQSRPHLANVHGFIGGKLVKGGGGESLVAPGMERWV